MTSMINPLQFAAGFILLLAATTSWAQPPSAAPYLAAPIPAGMARVWFYRELNPNDIITDCGWNWLCIA